MPWRGVTVSEQRQRFIEDYQLNYYSVTDLAERFGISRTTAYTHPGHQGKWINRFKKHGQAGFHKHFRRPHSCPWHTDKVIVEELVKLRMAHPHWGPRKLLDLMQRRDPEPRCRPRLRSSQEKGWSSLGGAIGGRTRDAPRASRRDPTTFACTCGAGTSGPRTTRGSFD